jgi:acetyl esterase/lipase
LHGALDTIVPADQSQLMAEKLSAAGVPHALIAIPWGTHGFDYASNNSPGGQITRFAIEWFLQRVTR